MSLRTRLSKPLLLADGQCLRTIGEAIDIVLAMPTPDVDEPRWRHVAGLLKTALYTGRDDDAALATSELEHALSAPAFGNAELAVHEKKPPAPSIRRQPKTQFNGQPKRRASASRSARPRRATALATGTSARLEPGTLVSRIRGSQDPAAPS